MADAQDHELRIARGAIRELEQKIFSQEQALAVLRASVARYQRDIEDPPAYLQDAVIRAAGLGAMAEELAALKKALTAALAQPARGAAMADAQDLIQPLPDALPRQLAGRIVDEVFGGAIEDASVIEDIYRVIAQYANARWSAE